MPFATYSAILLGILILVGNASGAEIDLKSLQPLEVKKKNTGGAYVGFFTGQTISQSASLELDYETVAGVPGHTLTYDVQERDGDVIVGLEVGYAWRTRYPVELGLEFEALFGSTQVDGVLSNSGNEGAPLSLSDVAIASADLNYAAFMLNGTLTLDLRKYRPQLGRFLPRFRPYVGAGIGGAQIWYRNQRIQSFGDVLAIPTASSASPFNIDEFVFANQIFAGLEYRVTDKIGLYTEYRRLRFEKLSDLESFQTDIVMGGLRWKY